MAKIGKVQEVAISKLVPYERNAKIHNDSQVEKIANSIKEFGFINPVLIDDDFNVIAGHGRIEGAKLLGLQKVPCLNVSGLTEQQRKAYILADNKLGELASWDMDLVIDELKELELENFDTALTGFDFDFMNDEKEESERKDLSDTIKSVYEIIVECDDEEHQEQVFNELSGGGL